VKSFGYRLEVGGSGPDKDVRDRIEQLEVEDHADLADVVRIRLTTAVTKAGAGWSVVDDELFRRLAEVKVLVAVGDSVESLVTANVIDVSTNLSVAPGASTVDVVAMDPTVRMDLEEKIRAWPDQADSDIASAIFGEYGFTPVVDSTQPSRSELVTTTLQRASDIRFLRQLAYRNGFECYVETNARSGAVEGHFHAPKLDTETQGVLAVDMGAATNVNTFNARYDMLKPAQAKLAGLAIEGQDEQKGEAESAAAKTLGRTPVLSGDSPRIVLPAQTGLVDGGELQTYAQAVADRTSWAIVAEGDLNTVAYGGPLRAKRPVLVRGAGKQFSGTYYVERVLHVFTGGSYVQRFTLRRNALGLAGDEQFAQVEQTA